MEKAIKLVVLLMKGVKCMEMAPILVNKHCTLIHFKYLNKLITVEDSAQLREVKDNLEEYGLSTSQDINPDLTHIHDCVEELGKFGNHIIISYIDSENYRINRILARHLKYQNPNFILLWFGPGVRKALSQIINSDPIDVLITENVSTAIINLLTREVCEWNKLDDVYVNENLQVHHDAYKKENYSNKHDRTSGELSEWYALMNGFVSFKTGLYPHHVVNGTVKHIYAHHEDITTEQLLPFSSYMGLNSALITNQSNESQQYEKVMALADEIDFYLPHLYTVDQNDKRDVSTLTFHSMHEETPLKYRDITFQEVKQQETYDSSNTFRDEATSLTFLKIEDKNDLDIFLEDIKVYQQTGRIVSGYVVESFLTNSCRWAASNQCPLSQLPRFELDEDQLIHPCGLNTGTIGTINDSHPQLNRTIRWMIDREYLERECSTCPVRDECSKCILLPKFLSRNDYCSIRKNYPTLEHYMKVTKIIKNLMQTIPSFSSVEINKIKVSHRYVSHVFPKSIKGELNKRKTSRNSYLMIIGKNGYTYQADTGKVISINIIMTGILEALIKGVDRKSIVSWLNQHQPDKTTCENLYTKTLSIFQKNGIIEE